MVKVNVNNLNNSSPRIVSLTSNMCGSSWSLWSCRIELSLGTKHSGETGRSQRVFSFSKWRKFLAQEKLPRVVICYGKLTQSRMLTTNFPGHFSFSYPPPWLSTPWQKQEAVHWRSQKLQARYEVLIRHFNSAIIMYAHTYRVLANCRCHITHVHGVRRAEEIVASMRNNTCFLKSISC